MSESVTPDLSSQTESQQPAKSGNGGWLFLGGLFAAAAGVYFVTGLPYRVPGLIAEGKDDAAKAIVTYLPTPVAGRPLDRDMDAALRMNNFPMAEFLLDHGADGNNSVYFLDRAPIDNKNVDLEQAWKLVVQKSLSKQPEYMADEAARAASFGEMIKLKALVAGGAKIDGRHLTSAAWGEDPAPLEYLLANFKFSNAEKCEALIASINGRGAANFHTLLAQVTPDRDTLDKMLLATADYGNNDDKVLGYLLKHYDFSQEIKQQALGTALKWKNEKAFNYLLNNGGIARDAQIRILHDYIAENAPQTMTLADKLVELNGGPVAPKVLTLKPR